jgi:UDP-3-O-[3-hydroxymyristoyl] glucosamine N-acyltransferase
MIEGLTGRLSVLKNAEEGDITYYVGDSQSHVSHLKNCTLICKEGFEADLPGVKLVHCASPQLEFYKLAERNDHHRFKDIYVSPSGIAIGAGSKISPTASISTGVVIGKNVTIGDRVFIGPNTVIYDGVIIKEGTTIGANSCLGESGIMWVWDGDNKVYLEQLGNLVIEENCVIGSLVEICRGSANENTVIGKNTCIAHGTMIGHGCTVGEHVHMANGVLLGGGCSVASYAFIGSGVVFGAGKKVKAENVLLGAGAVVSQDIETEGVYVGVPARKIRDKAEGKLSGVPEWKK